MKDGLPPAGEDVVNAVDASSSSVGAGAGLGGGEGAESQKLTLRQVALETAQDFVAAHLFTTVTRPDLHPFGSLESDEF